MKFFKAQVAAIALLACSSTSLLAAEFFLDSGDGVAAKNARSNTSVVLVGFSGNDKITDAQTYLRYNEKEVAVSVKALGSAGCSNPRPGLVVVISPDTNGKALGEKVGAYCQVTVTSLTKGAAVPSNALTLDNVYCSGAGGVDQSCSADSAQLAK